MRHLRATVESGLLVFRLLKTAWIALALCAILSSPRVASAHARLVSSTPISGTAVPAMPAEISISFSEAIDPAYSSASLLGSDGTNIAIGRLLPRDGDRLLAVPVSDPAAVAPGTYTLVWRVLSAVDGHVTTGTVAFSAGTGVAPAASGTSEPRPPWWRVALRWLELSGLALLTGLFLYALVIARQPVGALTDRIRGIAVGSAAVTLVVLVMAAYDLGVSATGARFFDPPALEGYRDLLVDTTGGRMLIVAALATVCMLGIIRFGSGLRWTAIAGAAAGLAALLSVSAAGHAAAASLAWRATLVDWVHFAAVAGWFGVLPFLWLSTWGADPARAISLLRRFSQFALAMLAAIIASGFVRAIWEVDGPRTLTESDYGRVLIVKHLLVVPILIAAGANRLVVVPRLVADGAGSAIATIRRFVAVELVSATLVLLAAAILAELAPANGPLPVDVASRPVTVDHRVRAGDLEVWLFARLAGDAGDGYTITVTGADGRAPADLQRVIVATRTESGGVQAGDRFDAEPLADSPGTFVFPALRLGLPGVWNLDVIVRRAGLEDVSGALSLDTTNAGAHPPRLTEDAWRLPRPTLPVWLFGFFSVASLLGGVVLVRRLRGVEPFAAAIMLTMTAIIAAGFAVQGYRQTVPVSAGTDLTNPAPVDSGAIQRAEGLYRGLCLQCHGEGGVGVATDDPAHTHAGSNLRDGRIQKQRDGDLYWALTYGVGGTEMPAFDVALTDQERWELIAYLRSLVDSPATPQPDS